MADINMLADCRRPGLSVDSLERKDGWSCRIFLLFCIALSIFHVFAEVRVYATHAKCISTHKVEVYDRQ